MRVWCVPEKQFLLRVNLSHTNKGAGECLATEKSEELTVMDSLACTMLTAVNEPKRLLFPPLDRLGSRVEPTFPLFSPRSGTRKASRRISFPPHARRARLEKVIYFYDAILFRRRRIYIRFEHIKGIIYVVATKAQSDRINFHIAQSRQKKFSSFSNLKQFAREARKFHVRFERQR
jgi:hypothetical protein